MSRVWVAGPGLRGKSRQEALWIKSSYARRTASRPYTLPRDPLPPGRHDPGDLVEEREMVSGPGRQQLSQRHGAQHRMPPVPLYTEGLKWSALAMLQNDPDACHPVGLFAIDEMADGIMDGRGAGENGGSVGEVVLVISDRWVTVVRLGQPRMQRARDFWPNVVDMPTAGV